MPPRYVIHAVVYEEEGWLVARCLQYDITAQARTHTDLYYELERLLMGRLVVGEELGVSEPIESLPPAPQKYWDMFERALSLEAKSLPFRLPQGMVHMVPKVEMRAS